MLLKYKQTYADTGGGKKLVVKLGVYITSQQE